MVMMIPGLMGSPYAYMWLAVKKNNPLPHKTLCLMHMAYESPGTWQCFIFIEFCVKTKHN